jgi:RNA polymerase sigma-70 factor (ECF subfamily)
MGAVTDAELFSGLRNGEEAAFSQLYAQHKDTLLFYIRSILRNESDALDAFQSLFARLVRDRHTLPDVSNVRSFLLTCARNEAITALRSRKRRERAVDRASRLRLQAVEPAAMPHEGDALADALASLPDEQREAVVLKTWAGATFAEIARLTDVSEGTAVSRYRYGLEKLKSTFGVKSHG